MEPHARRVPTLDVRPVGAPQQMPSPGDVPHPRGSASPHVPERLEWPGERRAEPRRDTTVTVTIGRVDVRAMLGPASRPRTSPRRGTRDGISLGEFVKRHEERRR
jgi:hypothetical protein